MAFRTLASQVRFTVLAKVPHRMVHPAQMRLLCEIASVIREAYGGISGAGEASDPNRCQGQGKKKDNKWLSTVANFNDTATLYWGHDAVVIEGRGLDPIPATYVWCDIVVAIYRPEWYSQLDSCIEANACKPLSIRTVCAIG